jgi:hypothetical protein
MEVAYSIFFISPADPIIVFHLCFVCCRLCFDRSVRLYWSDNVINEIWCKSWILFWFIFLLWGCTSFSDIILIELNQASCQSIWYTHWSWPRYTILYYWTVDLAQQTMHSKLCAWARWYTNHLVTTNRQPEKILIELVRPKHKKKKKKEISI